MRITTTRDKLTRSSNLILTIVVGLIVLGLAVRVGAGLFAAVEPEQVEAAGRGDGDAYRDHLILWRPCSPPRSRQQTSLRRPLLRRLLFDARCSDACCSDARRSDGSAANGDANGDAGAHPDAGCAESGGRTRVP